MKKTVLPIVLLTLKGLLLAQQPFQDKCSPTVKWRDNGAVTENFVVKVTEPSPFRAWATAQNWEIVNEYTPANLLVLRGNVQDVKNALLPRPDVLFVDMASTQPKEELPVPGHNFFVNRINVAHTRHPTQNGSSVTISIKENQFDTADVDFKHRATNAPNSMPPITSHANIVASIVGGAGNSAIAGRGVAWGANLRSNGFNNLLPDEDYTAHQVSVQNHAYGLDIENYYGALAMAYDQSVVAHPPLLHVFSAGNKGPEAPNTGTYGGLAGFANLTGNFKMAKNVLTVGAVDSFGQIAPFSSRGPAYDGRNKPDLVAFGQDGSSGSAALVSGAAAILQQALLEQTGMLPKAALVRAILLNTADDVAPPGPDFFTGFGSLNLEKAMQTTTSQQFENDLIGAGESQVFYIQVPNGTASLKIMLAWDEPPAMPGAPKALTNDLDLKVVAPDGSTWLPWVPNPFPHPDSLRMNAVRRRDTLNNAEQVALDNPPAGQYEIWVTGENIQATSQPFSLVWAWEKSTLFAWDFPVKNDAAIGGRDVLLRWSHTFQTDATGLLEYRLLDASDWSEIAPAVDLRQGWHRWLLPDSFAEAQVRMRVNGQTFESDTFLIARQMRMDIGFNCADSTLLYWNAAAPEATYLLAGLNEKYLEPLMLLSDTFIVLQKAAFPQQRFSVAPLGRNGTLGLRSPAPDTQEQGVACYFKNFLAELDADFNTRLLLNIGTRYGLQSVSMEKMKDTGFVLLNTWQPVEAEQFAFHDAPQQGANQYRARLLLNNGITLLSDTATVFSWGANAVLVFPNPTRSGSIQVVADPTEIVSFVVFDLLGRLILEEELSALPQTVELPVGLPKGCYPYFLRENGRLTSGGMLLVGF
ncbi:MAG: S8 family serine peptidase [Saprospiraceae bacterium]|nr:S8 family serine peptidase [Saprospiraceae bacterium]